MIPVLIAPVYNRMDLFERMLASLDEPIGLLVVVDNSPDGEMDPSDVLGGPWDWRVIRGVSSFGYPGSINLGIMQTPEAPWWMFASNDLAFGPGDLAHIAALMDETPAPRAVTGDRNDPRLLRWTYGAVNRTAIEEVGLMDEHAFHPIYYDDDDYERRCRLGGVEWIEFNGQMVHGDGRGSMTIRSSPEAARANQRTFGMNQAAYAEKWGGLPGSETFLSPYGLPVPLSFVRPDPAARAERQW